MLGRSPEVKRRRLVEVCLALAIVLGLAAITVGEGQKPLLLSGRLLSSTAP
ncbi:hypothetical protein [Lichenicoccus roseus]|uniref:hypothetical protein n=1 Tax=Lichenicoccus roseus TaxID=2683649 RepID=UPI0014862399|nr:hypothetical protein [Lichenicoccus roseus]